MFGNLAGDANAAFSTAELHLRSKIGRPMGQNDIACAIALAGNTVVVTMDNDLSAVPGLAVELGLLTNY